MQRQRGRQWRVQAGHRFPARPCSVSKPAPCWCNGTKRRNHPSDADAPHLHLGKRRQRFQAAEAPPSEPR